MHRRTLAAGLAAVGAAAALATAAPAQAAPPSGGCPANWALLAVEPLTDLGYRVPAQVDSPENRYSFGHQPGNANGYVCALPLGNQSVGGLQIYNFMDDSLQEG